MIKKTDKLRQYYKNKDFHKALYIVSGFTIGLTKKEINILKKAYECSTPMMQRFYKSIGTDMKKSINEGIELLKIKFITK